MYDPELTVSEARFLYFSVNGLGDGGYDDKWVKVEYGKLRVYFPNTRGRVNVVRHHDIHHILTEYETTSEGETEIGAWEVATGCTPSLTAWILNLSAFGVGLVFNPRGVYRAFIRGRQSSNLYDLDFNDDLLSQRVGHLRQQLSLDKEVEPASFIDVVAFLCWAVVGIITLSTIIIFVLSPLVLLLVFAWILLAQVWPFVS